MSVKEKLKQLVLDPDVQRAALQLAVAAALAAVAIEVARSEPENNDESA